MSIFDATRRNPEPFPLDRRLRITMVTPSLAAGGAERSVVLLSEGFLRRQHDVTIVSLYGSAVDSFNLPEGANRLALDIAADSRSFARALWNNVNRLAALRKAIHATRPDIVISHMSQTNVLCKLALSSTGCPVVLVEHSDPASNTRKKIWRLLRHVVYPHAATLVSVSHGINDYFKWLPESKRVVIPNPVSTIEAEIPSGEHCAGPEANKKCVVAMGRLIPVKGFDRLLSAFAVLAHKHANWVLVILGEGELRSDLEQQIKSLGLTGRVQLNGFVSNPFATLRKSEFFVMSSRSEGFPYALLEAMSCGLPAVAMDCATGPREIIRDGIDGILVPKGDVKALAAAMDHLMSDAGERQRLAARAPDVLERFGTDKVIAQWEALFLKLVKARLGQKPDPGVPGRAVRLGWDGEGGPSKTQPRRDLTARHLELHRNILRELGHTLETGARVLDFGCGAGNMVEEYCAAGYEAFGCDIRVAHESERMRTIDERTCSLPFADATFDFVFSDQVLEHVQDHVRAFAEIERVMKPGAISLHIFPAKLKPTEGHVFVPLGGLIQSRWWLTLWASLGVRNSFQKGKGVREVVELNSDYLRTRTNYLSRSQIKEAVSTSFDNLEFAERQMIKHTYGKARHIYSLVRVFPVIASLYSSFYSRVIFLRKTARS